jgi:hypothetical protein
VTFLSAKRLEYIVQSFHSQYEDFIKKNSGNKKFQKTGYFSQERIYGSQWTVLIFSKGVFFFSQFIHIILKQALRLSTFEDINRVLYKCR